MAAGILHANTLYVEHMPSPGQRNGIVTILVRGYPYPGIINIDRCAHHGFACFSIPDITADHRARLSVVPAVFPDGIQLVFQRCMLNPLIPAFPIIDIRVGWVWLFGHCLLYTSPSPRDRQKSRM